MKQIRPKPSTRKLIEKINTVYMRNTVVYGRGLDNVEGRACFARIHELINTPLKTMHYVLRNVNTKVFDYTAIIKDLNRIYGGFTSIRLYPTPKDNQYVVECFEGLKSKYPPKFLNVYYIVIFVILRACDKEYTSYYYNDAVPKGEEYEHFEFPVKDVKTLIELHYTVTGGKMGHGINEGISKWYSDKNMYKKTINHFVDTLDALFSKKSKFKKKDVIDTIVHIEKNLPNGHYSGNYRAQTPSFNILDSALKELTDKAR